MATHHLIRLLLSPALPACSYHWDQAKKWSNYYSVGPLFTFQLLALCALSVSRVLRHGLEDSVHPGGKLHSAALNCDTRNCCPPCSAGS